MKVAFLFPGQGSQSQACFIIFRTLHLLRNLAEFSRDQCRRTARSPHKKDPG
jgi:hypothetical protein